MLIIEELQVNRFSEMFIRHQRSPISEAKLGDLTRWAICWLTLGSFEGPLNIPQTLRITMWAGTTTIRKASIVIQATPRSESFWAFRMMIRIWLILNLLPRGNPKISTRIMESMDLTMVEWCILEKRIDRQNRSLVIMHLMKKLFSTIIRLNSNQTIKLNMTRRVKRVSKNIIQTQSR